MIRLRFAISSISSGGRCMFCNKPLKNNNLEKVNLRSRAVHPKSVLFEYCASRKLRQPEFEVIQNMSLGRPQFSVNVRLRVVNEENAVTLNLFSSFHSKKSDAVFQVSLAACEELKKRGLISNHLSIAENFDTLNVDNEPVDVLLQSGSKDRLFGKLQEHPKSILHNFGALIKGINKEYRDPKTDFQSLPGNRWLCKMSLFWPNKTVIETQSVSKKKAEFMACLKAIKILQTEGYFDEHWQPKFHTRSELQEFTLSSTKTAIAPLSDKLRSEIDELKTLIQNFNLEAGSTVEKSDLTPSTSSFYEFNEEVEETMEGIEDAKTFNENLTPVDDNNINAIMDMIRNKPYQRLDDMSLQQRNYQLFERYRRNIRRAVGDVELPIIGKRNEILDLLDENRVIIIAGGTGCGKTTQVAQFLLDNFIERLEGAKCNIIVTQPRRISAISVAERIVWERQETIGDTVGYHVRLQCRAPQGHGAILFATPAIVLRKLTSNPNFEGISHVIVDEVHERDLWTDFLLMVLKRTMKSNKDLKVILMSASMDSQKLSNYFDGCPTVTVEGRNYEVKEYFLDDLLPLMGNSSQDVITTRNKDLIMTDHTLIVDALTFIHRNRQEGAILCFLSSWLDITKVKRMFEEQNVDHSSYVIYPCHSQLPLTKQEKIFERTSPGVRKIILSTNIAETSITIDDIRYVVNSGTRKDTFSDGNLVTMRQEWASRSSQIQRRGRAGRVSDGECFHLFSKSTFDQMKQHSLPAILKDPLESVILFSKLCCPQDDPAVLLQEALDKPSPIQVDAAVCMLTDMKVLDEKRCLTTLGSYVAHIGCHPKLAVALLYATIFRCVEPLITLAGISQTTGLISARTEGTHSPADRYEDIQSQTNRKGLRMEKRFSGDSLSDHLTDINLFRAYLATDDRVDFINQNGLRQDNLEHCEGLRRLFAFELAELEFCEDSKELLDPASQFNENSSNSELVKAVLLAGLHDHMLYLTKGILDRGRIVRRKKRLADARRYWHMPPGNSLFTPSAMSQEDFDDSVFFYINRTLWNNTRMFRIDGISAVHPIMALLFGGPEPVTRESTISIIGGCYHVQADENDIARILDLRILIRRFVNLSLEINSNRHCRDYKLKIESLDNIRRRLVSIITDDEITTRNKCDS